MKRFIIFVLTLFLMMNTLYAQISGDWKGKLEVQGTSLTLVFHISDKDGTLSATLDVPDQGAMGLPLSDVTFENNILKVSQNRQV